MTTHLATSPAGESLTMAVARRLRGQLGERKISKLQLAHMTGMARSSVLRRLSGETPVNTDELVPLLDAVAATIRASPKGWLFPNGFGSHLSGPHVGVILRRVLETGTTPHQLRHRFASRAYQSTHDIRAVQELLGHASVATTQRYVAVADDALRIAVRSAA